MSFKDTLSRKFSYTKQTTSEKLGTAGEITPFSDEYAFLREKTRDMKTIYSTLLKNVTKILEAENASLAVTEKVSSFWASFSGKIGMRQRCAEGDKKTILHEFAGTLGDSAEIISKYEENKEAPYTASSLAITLKKYAQTTETIGDNRIDLNATIRCRVVAPLTEEISESYAPVRKAIKEAENRRITLDAYKTAYKTTSEKKEEKNRAEMEAAEEDFIRAMETAIAEMTSFTQNPAIAACIAAMIEAQQEYHRKAAELLAGIVV
ncbi:MAG: BAR domain-containing protein [Amphiamblys sp. WSBS2006]|nr:MAG: BAR domain-containing protein [Amphiamblys sp. WSBS2006]